MKEAGTNVMEGASHIPEQIGKKDYAGAAATTAAVIAVGAMIGLGAVSMIGGLVGGSKSEEEQAMADEEAAKEQYDNAKSAYDDVKSSLSEYQKAQKSIDELTVGTKEWVEAL
jgi:flagellar capping protein FliD